jgi:hypothetical protein
MPVRRGWVAAPPSVRSLSGSSAADYKLDETVLEVKCKCGGVGIRAVGTSTLNFVTHSPAPRDASGDPFLVGSGFNPNQIEWINREDIIDSSLPKYKDEYMPQGSSNPHYFCPCEERQYLGLDATRLLGMVGLNHKYAQEIDGMHHRNNKAMTQILILIPAHRFIQT